MKIAIVGAGKLGTKILSTLVSGEHAITMIDKDENKLNKIAQTYDILPILGNAKELRLLQENDIDKYDFLIATTDNDEENILIASFAKKLGTKHVIARVRDPEHMDQIDFIKSQMNIDFVVNPDLAITNEIYKYLMEKYTISNGIFSSEQVSMIQFNVKRYDAIVGKNMIEISKELPDMLVVAISRNGRIIIPHGSSVINADDTVFLLGEKSKIASIYDTVYDSTNHVKVENVMIVGGGKTGFFLADKLSKIGVNVKIIEIDRNRCYYLSTRLNDVMILNGDATDMSLLEEENLDDMDAFVTSTGFDEENLLLSLIAKRHGIEDVITKVSRKSYKDLIEGMGIEMALNPLDIVASNIHGFIHGTDNVISSHLIQGQGEIMEFVATKDMKITNKKLKDLSLPKGLLLAAIKRGDDVIIPRGDTMILQDDRVTIFYLLSDVEELEKVFASKGLKNKFLS